MVKAQVIALMHTPAGLQTTVCHIEFDSFWEPSAADCFSAAEWKVQKSRMAVHNQ